MRHCSADVEWGNRKVTELFSEKIKDGGSQSPSTANTLFNFFEYIFFSVCQRDDDSPLAPPSLLVCRIVDPHCIDESLFFCSPFCFDIRPYQYLGCRW